NEAYNFYLNGGYNFTPDTRGNFKLSYTLMNQTDTFYTSTRAGVNRSDLGGEVHNYLGMGSINSRVTDDLSLRAKVRYEGRHDSTPVLEYNSPAADRTGKNNHMNRDTVVAEGEANYRLPKDYRLIGGIKYEYWDREYLPLRQASWRERTEDYSGRVQLNKQLTETLGGSLAYIYSERDGSAFLISHDNNPGDIDPIHWGDRERHQWRLSMDWAATDKLSFHALVDGSLDTYHSEERWLGPEEGGTHNASIDASYQLNPDWSLTGFVSLNEITREQITVDKRTPTANGVWTADLRNIGYAGGVGIQGMPKTGFKLGADLQYTYDKQEYELSGPTHPTLTDLPDIDYHQFDLKLSADYSVSKNGSVKLGYNLTYLKNNDWIYDLDVSSEGSLYELPDNGFSHFIGASYRYQW
ncbi:MAG: MtrB/PioB family outer membrane beta-barrel protein, partial [Rhodospirillales bacterium]|nr:MtrB/PioB family outer membrane beta-barrel protein [Rhodospirillales bacterium]